VTVVRVNAGACGFVTRIIASKEDRREVRVDLESDCEAVRALGARVREMGLLGIGDLLSKGIGKNRVFMEGSKLLSHSGCPVLSAIIKAAEVELGLNVPACVSIEFESVPEKKAIAVKSCSK
jgi:Family of unknown function (DUF6951)